MIITLALVKRWRDSAPESASLHAAPTSAYAWGSVTPDLPLYALTVGGMIYYHLMLEMPARETLRYLFHTLFFEDPFWIASHNLLHAPLILLAALALLWWWQAKKPDRFPTLSRWWTGFFLACLLHTSLDIPVHVDDGPLLLFPFNWILRFNSPVSYWDDKHYGWEFSVFELALDCLLLGYLLFPTLWRRWRGNRIP